MDEFRRARQEEADRIMEIMDQAREAMYAAGNYQWDAHYPAISDISADIQKGNAWVVARDGRALAYGAVVYSGEPAYAKIDGHWLSDVPYVVVHRLAVAAEAKRQGVAQAFMSHVEVQARQQGVCSFRVDTKDTNLPMQHLLAKLGFHFCGTIYYPKGSRMAYEKLL